MRSLRARSCGPRMAWTGSCKARSWIARCSSAPDRRPMWRAPCSSSPAKRHTSPARFWRWMGAGVWAGERLIRGGHTLQWVCRTVESIPQLCDRQPGDGMYDGRCKLGERSEHVGPLEQIGPWQLQVRLVTDQVPIQQDVQVHGPRRPPRRIAGPPAAALDSAQVLDHGVHAQLTRETGHAVDEIRAL